MALKSFIFQAEASTGQEVKIFCSNSGSEHMVGHLQKVPHHTAPPHNISPAHTLNSVIPEEALSTLSSNKPDVRRL
jgi:hypothetical protein